MNDTKSIVTAAFLVALAVAFQAIPIIFSEALVLVTILSALPIYMIGKMNPRIGVAGYIVTFIVVMMLSVHEGVLFLFTNGAVGLSLGICHHYSNRVILIFPITSIILSILLSIMNFIIGIPVFGMTLNMPIVMQLGIIFIFSLLYTIGYFYFANVMIQIISKRHKK